MMASTPSAHPPQRSRLVRAGRLAVVGVLAIAGFWLLTEHPVHVLGALPYLLLLACPLLHLFMHRKHHGGGRDT
jgi:hypothetical protein